LNVFLKHLAKQTDMRSKRSVDQQCISTDVARLLDNVAILDGQPGDE